MGQGILPLLQAVTLTSMRLCKKESQVKSEKTAFSQEKSTKSQGKVKKYWLFVDFSWLKAIFFDFTWLSFLQRMRCVVSMFYGLISCPMIVDDQSCHETTLGCYPCAWHALVFLLLWCPGQCPLFCGHGQILCQWVHCYHFPIYSDSK